MYLLAIAEHANCSLYFARLI